MHSYWQISAFLLFFTVMCFRSVTPLMLLLLIQIVQDFAAKYPDAKDRFIGTFDSSLVPSVLDMPKSSSNVFIKMQGLGGDTGNPGTLAVL